MRFRKVKLAEKGTWDASNLLVGKNPQPAAFGDVEAQIHMRYNDEPSPEVPRQGGRIRGGRPRIPRPKAAQILSSKEQSFEDLVPSTPTAPIGTQRKPSSKQNLNNQPTPSKYSSLPVRDYFQWYWETLPPNLSDLTRADDFFLKNRNPPKLLLSAARFMEVPGSDVPEVAFVGRSNAGKSSLLNAIVDANVKDLLARTSATRGFTKTMNFYSIGTGAGVVLKKENNGKKKFVGSGMVLVDMPGYGDGSLSSWGVEIMKYIQSRKQLRRVFVLLDAEHGIKDKDRSLLASLRLAGVSHQIVLSKMDKIYIPKGKNVVQLFKKKMYPLKPKGTVEALRQNMEKLRPDINPPVGGGAIGRCLRAVAKHWWMGKGWASIISGTECSRLQVLKGDEVVSIRLFKRTVKNKNKRERNMAEVLGAMGWTKTNHP